MLGTPINDELRVTRLTWFLNQLLHKKYSIIKSFKVKNSCGYDEISTKILKISASYICSPLTYIINKSISTGKFPERLKYSIIKPLYKNGAKTDPSNYRPISLLTAISKVLEFYIID